VVRHFYGLQPDLAQVAEVVAALVDRPAAAGGP
jgi:hypothetical protein